MDLIEEEGSFEEAGKTADRTCSVLIALVGWAHGGHEQTMEELGSRTG